MLRLFSVLVLSLLGQLSTTSFGGDFEPKSAFAATLIDLMNCTPTQRVPEVDSFKIIFLQLVENNQPKFLILPSSDQPLLQVGEENFFTQVPHNDTNHLYLEGKMPLTPESVWNIVAIKANLLPGDIDLTVQSTQNDQKLTFHCHPSGKPF